MEELARGPDQWSFEEEERAAQEAAAREADRQMTPAMMMLAKQQAQDKPKEEKKVRAHQQIGALEGFLSFRDGRRLVQSAG